MKPTMILFWSAATAMFFSGAMMLSAGEARVATLEAGLGPVVEVKPL